MQRNNSHRTNPVQRTDVSLLAVWLMRRTFMLIRGISLSGKLFFIRFVLMAIYLNFTTTDVHVYAAEVRGAHGA